MASGALLLLSQWSASDRWIGLLSAPGVEIRARRGRYARVCIRAGTWDLSDLGDGGRITAPAVRFTGFDSYGSIVGFFLADRDVGEMTFSRLFDDRAPCAVVGHDELWITPVVELREV